jgi:hypothetical protein
MTIVTPRQQRRVRLQWFAVTGRNCFFALNVYPEEIERHRRSLKEQGFTVAGPFAAYRVALGKARFVFDGWSGSR